MIGERVGPHAVRVSVRMAAVARQTAPSREHPRCPPRPSTRRSTGDFLGLEILSVWSYISVETERIVQTDGTESRPTALRPALGRDGNPLGHQPHRGPGPCPALRVGTAPPRR